MNQRKKYITIGSVSCVLVTAGCIVYPGIVSGWREADVKIGGIFALMTDAMIMGAVSAYLPKKIQNIKNQHSYDNNIFSNEYGARVKSIRRKRH